MAKTLWVPNARILRDRPLAGELLVGGSSIHAAALGRSWERSCNIATPTFGRKPSETGGSDPVGIALPLLAGSVPRPGPVMGQSPPGKGDEVPNN